MPTERMEVQQGMTMQEAMRSLTAEKGRDGLQFGIFGNGRKQFFLFPEPLHEKEGVKN